MLRLSVISRIVRGGERRRCSSTVSKIASAANGCNYVPKYRATTCNPRPNGATVKSGVTVLYTRYISLLARAHSRHSRRGGAFFPIASRVPNRNSIRENSAVVALYTEPRTVASQMILSYNFLILSQQIILFRSLRLPLAFYPLSSWTRDTPRNRI